MEVRMGRNRHYLTSSAAVSHNHCNSCALETSFQPSTVTEWLLYSKQCTYHTDTFCDISKCCLGV